MRPRHGSPPTSRPYANPRKARRRPDGRGLTGSVHPAALPAPAGRSAVPVPGVPRPHPAPGPRRRCHHGGRHDPARLVRKELAPLACSAADWCRAMSPPATSSPQPRPTPGLHREDPSRRPRRRQHPPRPRPRPPAVQPGQRKALLIRDQTCRAEGCDIPGTWAEAHHLDPWSTGGSTDLANGILLCSHHHHRAHDTGYRTDRLPNGDIRFHRRR